MKITSVKGKTSKKINSKKRKTKKFSCDSNQMLIIIQSVICVLVLCLAILIKTFGGSLYQEVRLWYIDKINDSIILEDRNDETPNESALFVNKTNCS